MLKRTGPPTLVIFPILVLVLLIGCSEDTQSPDPEQDEPILTLELGEYFLNAFAFEGIVFVADMQGEVLDVATWSGAATIALSSNARLDSVSFTLVRHRNNALSLASEIGIPVGTTVSFDGGYAHHPTGEGVLAFDNAPVCDYYMVSSSLFSQRWPEQLPASVTIPVHWEEVDAFVRVDPVGGWPLGGWYHGLRAGETATMNLEAYGVLVPLIRHAVKVPTTGDRLTAALSRDTREGLARKIVGFSHDNYYDEDIPDSVIMYGPALDPAQQTSFFHCVTEGDPNAFFSLDVRGEVPTEFAEPTGELSIVSAVPDSAVFKMTGSWDRFSSNWYGSGEFRFCTWYFEGKEPLSSYSFPQLPQEVLDLAPGLALEGFWLQYLVVENEPEEGVVYSKGFYMPFPEDAADDEFGGLPGPGMPPRLRE